MITAVEALVVAVDLASAVLLLVLSARLWRVLAGLGLQADPAVGLLLLATAQLAGACTVVCPDRLVFSAYVYTGVATASAILLLTRPPRPQAGAYLAAFMLIYIPVAADLLGLLGGVGGALATRRAARLGSIMVAAAFALRLIGLLQLPAPLGGALLVAGELLRAGGFGLVAFYYALPR